MKNHIYKTSNRLYGYILGLLGFSIGCQSCGEQADMYGPPPPSDAAAVYIKGKVTDKTDAPINNIAVVITGGDYSPITTFTDKDGKYSIMTSSASTDTKYNLIFRDDDGPQNGGEFSSETQDITPKSEDFAPDERYLKGLAVKTVNTLLEEKVK